MTAKFGTSGLRGLVEHLTDGTSERYVRGFLRYLLETGQAVSGDHLYIGQDFRPSSPEIAQQAASAAKMEGFVPIDCGTVPTPALAFYAMGQGAPAIMITGSHIPADRNGIKFYRRDGEIDKSDEAGIKKLADRFEAAKQVTPSGAENHSQIVKQAFLKRYTDVFPKDLLSGKRIGVYEHSSVARDLIIEILKELGANTVSLGRSDTFIPVDTEAVSEETMKKLSAWTRQHGLDAIVSTDGDGDRPLVSDEEGQYIKGDVLGFITSKYLEAEVIATPISSNSGIKTGDKTKVINTRIGSPYVIEAMQKALRGEGGTVVGFEANGGFLLASSIMIDDGELAALPTRDCMLPIIAVLASAIEAGSSLVDHVKNQNLPITHSGRIQEFSTEKSNQLIESLNKDEAQRKAFFETFGQVQTVDQTDGFRASLSTGEIIHLRPSGNAPEMRVYVEAKSVEAAQQLVDSVIGKIESV